MYLHRTKWKFNLNVLEKGDVLFTRSKIVGTGIAKITKGRFGHVMLYLGSTIIHADTKGVWSKNPQRIMMNDQSRLAAYRLKDPLSPYHLERIESYARSRVGSLYSIPEAAASLRESRTTTDRFLLDRQFCSRLVAQSFAEVGINLASDFDYCTPSEIAESPLLREVRDAVVPANEEDIDFCKTPDYNRELQQETYRWLEQVRNLSEKHQLTPILSQKDVGQLVIDHPQFDAKVCAYIKNTNYLSFYDADNRKNPWRYNPLLMMQALINSASPEDGLAIERRQNTELLEKVRRERLIAIRNAQSGLGYFELEEQLLTKRFAQMLMWKQAVDYASSVIGRGIPAAD